MDKKSIFFFWLVLTIFLGRRISAFVPSGANNGGKRFEFKVSEVFYSKLKYVIILFLVGNNPSQIIDCK